MSTENIYDLDGRLAKVFESFTDGPVIETEYEYDDRGVIVARKNVCRFQAWATTDQDRTLA
jgi:hypothetical protein